MKIYIASPYKRMEKENNEIYRSLIKAGYEAFLPKSINIDAISQEQMAKVAEICYEEIDTSDVILIVFPSGISVANEAGYAISQKRREKNIKIVLLNLDVLQQASKIRTEAMLIPYVDKEVSTIGQLMQYLALVSIENDGLKASGKV